MTIRFDDLPSAAKQIKVIPSIYRGLRWNQICYTDKSYMTNNYPENGYAACFTNGNGPHLAFFEDEASISVENTNEIFNFISLDVCAIGQEYLQLTIIGQRNSLQINTHRVVLRFGKPQNILLEWNNIDKIIFKSSDAIRNRQSVPWTDNTQTAIIQMKIGLF